MIVLKQCAVLPVIMPKKVGVTGALAKRKAKAKATITGNGLCGP